MRRRAHRRNRVVWGPSVGPADRYGAPGFTRLAATRQIHRCIRIGALLMVIGLMRLARAPRWRLLLAGAALTTVGIMLRSGAWSAVLLPGLLLLLSALLVPASPDANRKPRRELERELAVYATPVQRRDLEATLDRYPDRVTHELRNILANQAITACNNQIPGAGRR
jgi:hypothetical protein